MIQASEWIVLVYAVLYLAALGLAAKRRETFPWMESVLVILVVGLGFTSLVYLATWYVTPGQISAHGSPAQLVFTVFYVVLVTFLLIFRPVPESWRGQFLKEKATALAFKLVIFVLIPLGMMRVLFKWTWADLGFSLGDIPGQLAAAGLLILLFGGFNLLAGSAAAPIRKGLYSRKQVGFGYLLAFTWNFLETGLVEEFFFRAFLQTQFTLAFSSPLAGICLDSLVFGLAHAPGIYLRSGDKQGPLGEKPTLLNTILYAVIVLSTAGWFTGVLYWRIQSLLAPVLVHAGLDAAAHTPEFIQALKLPK